MMNAMLTVDLKYSRRQETAADLFALNLLQTHYNHVGGATDFLNKLGNQKKSPLFLKFFLTHPFENDRIKNIEKAASEHQYPTGKLRPLALPL
jgi:predicted Zn-dependent protease